MSLKKLDDILIKIQKYHPKYIDLNLNRINRLLQDLGNPHQFLPPTIHIAGTNGKGSTLSILRSMLKESGLTVHSYTSPHFCLLYTSPSPRDLSTSRMPSSA